MPPVESDSTVSVDSVISAVADEHRRAVLRLLNESDRDVMHLSELADGLADRIDNRGRDDDEHRYRIRIALQQIHLPKLRSYGLIRYDADTKQTRAITGELSQELLAVIESYEPE